MFKIYIEKRPSQANKDLLSFILHNKSDFKSKGIKINIIIMDENIREKIKSMGIMSCPVLIKEGGNAIGNKAIITFFTQLLSTNEMKSKQSKPQMYPADHESYALSILQENEDDVKTETTTNFGSLSSSKAATIMQERQSLIQQRGAPIVKTPATMIPQQAEPDNLQNKSPSMYQKNIESTIPQKVQEPDYDAMVSDFLQATIKEGGD
jgi:hypothetical protein